MNVKSTGTLGAVKEMSGRMKFFNGRFGFIETPAGDVFLLGSVCDLYGSVPLRGSLVTINAIFTNKGWQVLEILQAEAEAPEPVSEWEGGTLKLLSVERGFDFVILDRGPEAFLHAEVARQKGFKIAGIFDHGKRVAVIVRETRKGLCVTNIRREKAI